MSYLFLPGTEIAYILVPVRHCPLILINLIDTRKTIMSISTRHSVVPFIAGKSQAMNGQRLSKVGYKTTEKQKAKFPSVCASVPMIASSEILANSEALIPYVKTLLEDAQDKILKSLYESSDGTLLSVGDDDLSISSILAFLESESTGGRLTKDVVSKWFDSTIAENLTVVLADKLGFSELTDENEKVIGKHLNGFKELIALIPSGKAMLTPVQMKSCKTALSLDTEESDIGRQILAKIEMMEKKPVIADLLEI